MKRAVANLMRLQPLPALLRRPRNLTKGEVVPLMTGTGLGAGVWFLVAGALAMLAFTGLAIRDGLEDPVSRQRLNNNLQVADALMITDLALWTEARYTRHRSQADFFTAFQNGPAAPDQFPSGTWVPPWQPRKTPRLVIPSPP